MRSFIVVSLIAATAAAHIMHDSHDRYIHNVENSFAPPFSRDQLVYPIVAPLDVGCAYYEKEYHATGIVTRDGRVQRTIFKAPYDCVFKEIMNNNEVIFTPNNFLGYKVVVDYVNQTPRNIRIYGINNRGVYGVRYIINSSTGFKKVSRPIYIRHRQQFSVPYTFDLLGSKEEKLRHSVVRENLESEHQVTVYYPMFNHYIETVVAGSTRLWTADPATADTCLEIMYYKFEDKNYCIIRSMDWNGFQEETLYVEWNGTFSFVAQVPKESFYLPIGSYTVAGRYVNKIPNYMDFTPPSGAIAEQYKNSTPLKIDIHGDFGATEGLTATSQVTQLGNYELHFSANKDYLIYRLTDGNTIAWDRPDMGIKSGVYIKTFTGFELLDIAAISDRGSTFAYSMEKRGNFWWPISEGRRDQRLNPITEALSKKLGKDVKLIARDADPTELKALRTMIGVPFEVDKLVHYAWTTDRSKVGKLFTKKHCTAVKPFYVFSGMMDKSMMFVDFNGKYISTETVHYKVVGLELLAFNTINLTTGRSKIHYWKKRDGLWAPISREVFEYLYDDIMAAVKAKYDPASESTEDADVSEIIEESFQDPTEALLLPYVDEFDNQASGIALDPTEKEEGEGEAETEETEEEGDEANKPQRITLELKGHADPRYKLEVISSPDKSIRVIYKPAEGYEFSDVKELGQVVFSKPGHTVTEVLLDEMPNGQYFLQVLSRDRHGGEHIHYYYKTKKHRDFMPISRSAFSTLRFRCMSRVYVDVNSKHRGSRCLIRFDSRHYKGVQSFLPRYNCVINEVRHGDAKIWEFDELNPEVVTRVVTFKRDNIRGVLLQIIGTGAQQVDKLYLNTNPKTNEYALFMHKGNMFSLFKKYLLNRRSGTPGFRRYAKNDVNWDQIIEKDSEAYERIHTRVDGTKMTAAGEEEEEPEDPEADELPEGGFTPEEAAAFVNTDPMSAEPQDAANAGLTEEEIQKRQAIAARIKHKKNVKDNSYYVDFPIAIRQVVHKGGVVWDAEKGGDVCLDFRKFSKGQYRLVECEIMSPDGTVENKYFMNTHNGVGSYREVELCKVGTEL